MIITSGKFKNKKVNAPDETITRPTLSKVRMSVFNILQSVMDFEDSNFLDMYAGSGIMGLEALSRGFREVTAIEKNRKVFQILKDNYKNIAKDDLSYKLLIGDSLKTVNKLNKNFDVIYIDPPYYLGIYEQSLEAVKNISNGIIIVEHVTDIDFENYSIIKQKKYGDKYLTIISI